MDTHKLRSFAIFLFIMISSLSYVFSEPSTQPPPPSEAHKEDDLYKNTALLQWVDKITGKSQVIEAPVGEQTKHAALTIKVSACKSASDLETPENKAFLEIWEFPPENLPKKLFAGWMFSSSPSLSTLISPRHNLWLLKCKNIENKEKRTN